MATYGAPLVGVEVTPASSRGASSNGTGAAGSIATATGGSIGAGSSGMITAALPAMNTREPAKPSAMTPKGALTLFTPSNVDGSADLFSYSPCFYHTQWSSAQVAILDAYARFLCALALLTGGSLAV